MFCGQCGTQNPDTNNFCKNCGKPLKKNLNTSPVAPPAPAAAPVVVQPAAPIPSPYPVPPAVTQDSYIPAGIVTPPLPGAKPSRDWPGIGSILLGIVSWLVIPYILGIVAILLGGISLNTAKKAKRNIAVLGVIGIIIALASMLVNYFYLFIF